MKLSDESDLGIGYVSGWPVGSKKTFSSTQSKRLTVSLRIGLLLELSKPPLTFLRVSGVTRDSSSSTVVLQLICLAILLDGDNNKVSAASGKNILSTLRNTATGAIQIHSRSLNHQRTMSSMAWLAVDVHSPSWLTQLTLLGFVIPTLWLNKPVLSSDYNADLFAF